MIRPPLRALPILAWLAIALTATLASAEPAAAPSLKAGEWPQAHSDLKADPNIRFGSLPNGMRYAILRNATPPGQASMRLVFRVGSLMERDDQQGLAHFLEHMAFNGSTNLPGRGEMVKTLERLGLAFGADTNASTGFDNTTYKFDLPKSDTESLDTALMLLREIAGNLTLDQGAMDQERGVILSEERVRDTPSYRVTKARIAFDMAGQRPPDRFPIGLVPVIENAKSPLLADIYHAYYRPERATLIVVGDFDPDAMEAKIKAKFGDWRGQGAPGADPGLGRVKKRSTDFHVEVQPGSATNIELAWMSSPDLSADTVDKRRRGLIDQLAMAVLNRRLGALGRTQDPPFIAAGAFRGDQLRAAKVTGVLVSTNQGQWKRGLAAAEAEVRRAVQFGVRPDELQREITEVRAALKAAVAGAATRRTPQLADEIVGTLGEQQVETAPADDLALFDQVTKSITPDVVSAALKSAFDGQGPLVLLAEPDAANGDEAALQTTFQTALAAPITAPEAPRQVDWPYGSFGATGKVAEQTDAPDLDTVFVRFANGVRLTVKQTKFSNDQVLVKVRYGGGYEALAPNRQSMIWARAALIEGGLRQISTEDAERALAGQVYGAVASAEGDAFAISGRTRPADLETQLQVLAAYVSDPGWRPEALERLKAFGQTLDDQYLGSDTGVFSRDLQGLLHSGDRRWTFPSKAEISAESEDQLKSELGAGLATGPVEVVVVGDITVDKAIAAVADTFGALPPRAAPASEADTGASPAFPAPTADPVVETHAGRADQGIAFVAWPTEGYFADPDAARADTILSRVLQLRLIDVLRLKEGVTYSPAASAVASTIWPHYGFVSAQMEAPPEKLPGFFTDVDTIAADLAAKPIGADELERAKKPAVEALEKAMVTNEYWLSGLSGAQTDKRRLDILRSAEAGLQRVSAADVQAAAARVLRRTAEWRFEVRPKVQTATADAAH